MSFQAQVVQAQQLFEAGNLNEAALAARNLLRSDPRCAAAWQVLGLVDSRQRRPHEAIRQLEQALAIKSDLVPSLVYLGISWTQIGLLEQAAEAYSRALFLMPDHSFARFNRAMLPLKPGQFQSGWADYEWRFKTQQVSRPEINRPRWDGSPLHGRSIFIHAEWPELAQDAQRLEGSRRRLDGFGTNPVGNGRSCDRGTGNRADSSPDWRTG